MIKIDKKRKSRSGAKSQGTVPAFLLKTYEILENPAYIDIISWNKEGNAFIVKRINEFSEKVLPKYFKHNNFASFVRQLNMYDFHKSRHENNENEFRHKLFKRGQKHLLSEIKRKVSEGPTFPNNQLVPATKDFDMDKLRKEATHFTRELGSLKSHQTELEKVTKMIYNQNTQLLKENKLLWNELIKNKEKYERKIEKLMMFIFSIMQYGSNLGPSTTKKSLTNSEISNTLSEITGDPEQGKRLFGENGQLSLPDKKESEKLYRRISDYFQNKGNETNIDSLLDQIQNEHNIDEFFKNQPKPSEGFSQENQQNIDPNLAYSQFQMQPEPFEAKRRGRQRRSTLNPMEEAEYGGAPVKQIKTEPELEPSPEPLYSLKQNVLSAQKPINIMNQEMPNEDLRREMQPYGINLSRGPSYLDTDMGGFGPPGLVPQKSSNDFLFQSPKPYQPMKEDEVSGFYNIEPYNTGEDKMPDFNQVPKNDMPIDEIPFSPTTFINNNSNGFNFNQPFDDTLYRN